jgi:hypothetical protein
MNFYNLTKGYKKWAEQFAAAIFGIFISGAGLPVDRRS